MLVPGSMENSTTSTVPSEEAVNVDLIEAVYLYLTEARYPKGYTTANKRATRKKAQKFVERHGILSFKKKKSGKVR